MRFLSDKLAELEDIIRDFALQGGDVIVDAETVSALVGGLQEMKAEARALENCISRHSWNDAARAEKRQRVIDTIINELSRPGSNLVAVGFKKSMLQQPNCAATTEGNTP